MSEALKINPDKLQENISVLQKISDDNEVSNLINSITSITTNSEGDNVEKIKQIKTPLLSNKVQSYVDWYMSNISKHGDYKTELQNVLTDYCINNPNSKNKYVDSLSLEQINELNKKLNYPDYHLNLE